jgi:curved DNA-binding protein
LAGKGGPGRNGGKPGDLYFDLPLAPWEAALGAAGEIPTRGGHVELNIKPGTSSGQRLRLAQRGLPSPGGGAGDLYAVARIEVPRKVGKREQEPYEQLAAASDFNPRKHFREGRNENQCHGMDLAEWAGHLLGQESGRSLRLVE